MIARRAGVRPLSSRSFVCCLVLLSLEGCGSEDNGVLVPVVGTLTYNDKPLTKGEINFIPEKGGGARGAHGTINEDGRYTLSSYGVDDGAHPGKYKVTILSRGEDLPVPAKKKKQMMEEDMQGSGKLLIPAKYANPTQSGLTADVVVGTANEFNFSLKD
jgi:hypothetical protein